MNKIGLIVPYFGKFPPNFQMWLNSCKENNPINWLVFTDDRGLYDYPSNVAVHYLTFGQFKEKLAQRFDFRINIDTPYKLTDFKVAYGDVFGDYLKEFDFWGFCDVDLIFGKIRKFITEEILHDHDKIMSRGHFTLFRNSEAFNTLYKRSLSGQEPYRKVFSSPKYFHFDEWGNNGINRIAMDQGIPMYDQVSFHDLDHKKYKFHTCQVMNKTDGATNSIYIWDKGCLWRFYLSQQKLAKEEIFYLHFQKREMEVAFKERSPEKILILPNKYVRLHDVDDEQLEKTLKKRAPLLEHIRFGYVRLRKKLNF